MYKLIESCFTFLTRYANILCSLAVCSLFYGKDPNSIPKKISKAIITSVLMFPTSSLFPTSFIGLHTLISKTYRPEEEMLKYDDVAELARYVEVVVIGTGVGTVIGTVIGSIDPIVQKYFGRW